MSNKQFHFRRRRFVIFVAVATGIATFTFAFALFSVGPHLLFASRKFAAPRHSVLARESSETVKPDCDFLRCRINGFSFNVPADMVDTRKVVRVPDGVALLFEDSTRKMHVTLVAKDPKDWLANRPLSLNSLTSPEVLEKCVSTSSDDFSFLMSRTDLRVHEWALETRALQGLDRNFDRYARFSKEGMEVITISIAPESLDSKSRLRTFLAWEHQDIQSHGTILFGDLRRDEVGWIAAVAKSISVEGTGRLIDAELLKLSDEELLALFEVHEP